MKNLIRNVGLIALTVIMGTALAKGPGPKPPPDPEPVNLFHVITVSEQNGDFKSPVEAIESITDANETAPYVIKIGPGVYDIGSSQIVMKPWVTLQGSGKRSTKITGANTEGDTSAIVIGADNAVMTDLTIENRGGGDYSYAISNNMASPTIKRVNAMAYDGYWSTIGILNNSSSPTMTFVSAAAYGNSNMSTGIHIFNGSNPVMTHVNAKAVCSYAEAYGVSVFESSPVMLNVNASASGCSGYNSTAVYIAMDSAPFISDSTIESDYQALVIYASSPQTRIVNTKIDGLVVDSATEITQCRGNYDGNLNDVDC